MLLERLEEFWNIVTAHDPITIWPDGDAAFFLFR
jgi:hypothetical protein